MRSLCLHAAIGHAIITLPTGPPGGIINNNGTCFIASDVVFLQDTTGSFMDDMPVVHAQIPTIIKEVGHEFPGTLFGVAEFRDKPYFPIGEKDDFCYKLRFGKLTNKETLLQFAYDILQPSGGGDLYESHFQAGIDVVLDKEIGWRPLVDGAYNVKTKTPADPEKIKHAMENWTQGNIAESGARIVVMITDAAPHIPGDMTMCAPGAEGWEPSWDCPQNLPANPGIIVDNDPMIACTEYDFASESQFVNTALDNNVIFLFLTTEAVSDVWKDVNENKFKNPPSFHQTITDDSSNLKNALISALKSVSEVSCEEFTTTTTTSTPSTTHTTATSPATTTTSPTTHGETTTQSGIVTTAGSSQATTPGTTKGDECPPPIGNGCPGHPCDDLVVKIGPAIKKLSLDYAN